VNDARPRISSRPIGRGPSGQDTSASAVVGVLAATASLSALLVWTLPGAYRALPLMQPDSAAYLAWAATRPIVYPAFLFVIRQFSPALELVTALQFVALLSSTAWLSLSIVWATRSALLGAVFGAAVMLHPQVVSYAFTVLPESLLASLLMAHAAASIRLLRRPHYGWACAVGLTLAAAVLIKPVAIACLAGAPVVVAGLWNARKGVRLMATCATAVALPIAAASTVNLVRAGVFSPQAMGGYALLGVTSTFIPDASTVAAEPLNAALIEQLRPVRDELQRIDSLDMYYFYSSAAYHVALVRAREAILAQLRVDHPAASEETLFLELNSLSYDIARLTIRAAPGPYLRHVIAHLYGLWLMPLVQNTADRQPLERRLAEVRQLAPLLAAQPIMFRFLPPIAYWPFKSLLALALACSVPLVMAWAWAPSSPVLRAGAHAALLLHSYHVITASAQTGLPRYALSVWPLTMLVVVAAVASVTSRPWPARTVLPRA
jgi:hypothetical protein